MRRQADLFMSAEFILGVLQDIGLDNPDLLARTRVIENAIPDDARPLLCYTDPNRHDVVIRMESETFEPVALGDDVPMLPPPIIQRIDPPAPTEATKIVLAVSWIIALAAASGFALGSIW